MVLGKQEHAVAHVSQSNFCCDKVIPLKLAVDRGCLKNADSSKCDRVIDREIRFSFDIGWPVKLQR